MELIRRQFPIRTRGAVVALTMRMAEGSSVLEEPALSAAIPARAG